MKLWLISQSENTGYDTYDSAVVAAETEAEAKATHPGIDFPETWPEWESTSCSSDWASRPDKVTAKLIGDAVDGITGVVCASFNAG